MGRGSCTSGPRSITPQASLYRWRTTDQELGRRSSSRYSIHYSLRNRAVWGWVCPSAGRSLKPMVAGCGLSRQNPRVPSLSFCCSLTVRRLLVHHEESNRTIFRLVRVLKAQTSPNDRDDKVHSGENRSWALSKVLRCPTWIRTAVKSGHHTLQVEQLRFRVTPK